MKLRALILFSIVSLTVPAGAQANQPSYSVKTLAGGLSQPTSFTWDGTGRLWVAERTGRVVRIEQGKPTEALNLSEAVGSGGDRGLLGIAADKDWNNFPYLYLLYSSQPETGDTLDPTFGKLAKVRIGPDGTIASEPEVILGNQQAGCMPADPMADCLPSEAPVHGVGAVRTSPDGAIFLSNGSAGAYGTVNQESLRSLNPDSLAGKLLRVDRNGDGYPGNPFCPESINRRAACARIWASGFRNPFRFTLTPKGPLVGDVGEDLFEELNLVTAGQGYGWPCFENQSKVPGYRYNPLCAGLPGAMNRQPLFAYKHRVGIGDSITAGPIMTTNRYPKLKGKAVYSDYAKGWLRWVDPENTKKTGQIIEGQPKRNPPPTGAPVDLQEGPEGQLVWADIGLTGEGRIMQLEVDAAPVKAATTISSQWGKIPLSISGRSAKTALWQWGDGKTSRGKIVRHTYRQAGVFTVTAKTADATKKFIVRAGWQPEPLQIQGPSKAAGGTPVNLTLSRPGSWQVLLHHKNHLHPVASGEGSEVNFTASQDHGLDSFYEVSAKQGEAGFEAKASHKISYRSAKVVISGPRGLIVDYGPERVRLPYSGQEAEGRQLTVAAPRRFSGLSFLGWSSGPQASQQVTIGPEGLSLAAAYH